MKNYTFFELSEGKKESIDVFIGEEEIGEFVKLSGDTSPIHVDDAFARSQGLRSRIAHGALLTSYVSRLIGTRLPGANGILHSVMMEFRRPCYPGTTLRIEGEIIKKTESVKTVRIEIKVIDTSDGTLLATGKVQSGFQESGSEPVCKEGDSSE